MSALKRCVLMLVASTCLLGSSCPKRTVVLRVTATATLRNAADTPGTALLSLPFTPGRPGPRVTSSEIAPGITYLRDVILGMTPAGLTTDAVYLQVFSRPSSTVTGEDERDLATTERGDIAYIDSHMGDMMYMALEAPDSGSATSRSLLGLDPKRTQVSAWLARVELDDGAVPWTAFPGTSGCQLIPGTQDCFDMSSLLMGLTDSVTAGLRAAFDPPPATPGRPTPTDPVPLVRTSGVARLASYIPNIVPLIDAPGRRVRGVGFIFEATLFARAAGLTNLSVDVGAPEHLVKIWLPVSMLFESDAQGGLMITIDPFDLAGSSRSQMAGRIALRITNPGPDPVSTEVGNLIATLIFGLPPTSSTGATGMAGMVRMPSPSLTTAMGLAAGFFNNVRGGGPLPADFDVVLVPDAATPTSRIPMSPQLVPPAAMSGIQLVFLQ